MDSASISRARARRQRQQGGGVVMSLKWLARSRRRCVCRSFQAYIGDLEANMAAYVYGRIGRALLTFQRAPAEGSDVSGPARRGRPAMQSADRVTHGQVAAAHGLFEGGRWCNSDYGHAQVDVTAAGCGERRVRTVQRQ
jgi:hypothetical protein